MKRIDMVKEYVNNIFNNISSAKERTIAFIHTYGVAQFCSVIAAKRELNPELAYIGGLLHDIYAYYTGSGLCHAVSGADMARVAIREMNIFTDEEMVIILSSIFYHSDKVHIHDEYDEVLKDADAIQHFMNEACYDVIKHFRPRLSKVLEEFGIALELSDINEWVPVKTKDAFRRALFADIAESIASQNIIGEKDDKAFMDIIKYYPEPSVFNELNNNWCAAFVYHCVLMAGLELPIKQPPYRYRFAGVGTWYEWAKDHDICFYEADGFIPARGDIVIYNNIIPPEDKPKNSPWHDHIGIVLSCDKEYLLVAEGNINSKNVSGIIKRKRDNTIGCFIRIPDGFEYDYYKCDYKEHIRNIIKQK